MRNHADLSRRAFLKDAARLGVGASVISVVPGCRPCGRSRCGSRGQDKSPDLAVAKGGTPAANCLAAVEVLGGFSRFVKPGDKVVIKPNPIGRNRPEMAIHTHPDMVGAVVAGCISAGAREVLAISHDDERSMALNGTRAAVEGAGGLMKAINAREDYREVVVPRGRILGSEAIAIDLLEADVFINMPIAKHHAGAEVTLAMKNLMGINWDRIRFHQTDLQQTIAELAGAVRHDLIIMDANHVLLSNGPAGPGEVIAPGQVVAGIDPVAVDAFTMRHFNRAPETIGHIRIAHELGIGEIDLARLKIKEFAV